MTDLARCLGTAAAECQSCARRIERVAADWMTTWMVPIGNGNGHSDGDGYATISRASRRRRS